MNAYTQLIVLNSLPLTCMTNSEFRQLSKYNNAFSINTVKEVIYKLTEIVEQKISKEKKKTRGSILYDEWTRNGTSQSDVNSPFYECELGDYYISKNSEIGTDPEFESGVVKTQRGLITELNEKERKGCIRFKNHEVDLSYETVSATATIAERIAARKRQKHCVQNEYIDAGFSILSLAEVKRI